MNLNRSVYIKTTGGIHGFDYALKSIGHSKYKKISNLCILLEFNNVNVGIFLARKIHESVEDILRHGIFFNMRILYRSDFVITISPFGIRIVKDRFKTIDIERPFLTVHQINKRLHDLGCFICYSCYNGLNLSETNPEEYVFENEQYSSTFYTDSYDLYGVDLCETCMEMWMD